MAELAMLADGLPRGGHPSTARYGAGQGQFAGWRSNLCATIPTIVYMM